MSTLYIEFTSEDRERLFKIMHEGVRVAGLNAVPDASYWMYKLNTAKVLDPDVPVKDPETNTGDNGEENV